MKTSSHEVLIIDLRGVIARDESTVARHIDYGKYLQQVSHGEKSLTVITRGNTNNIESQSASCNPNCKFLFQENSSFSLLRFFLFCRKYIKVNKSRVKLLVASDPWETYWFCRFLTFFSEENLKIQVQLHADIFDPNWIKLSFANKIRICLLFLNSESILNLRLVNAKQQNKLVNRFPNLEDRLIVAPVPLSISPINSPVSVSTSEEAVIGFVGRIHKDRGLELFLKVVQRLNQDGWKGKVLVVGGGPESRTFQERLAEIVDAKRIFFAGVKSGEELSRFWNEIDVYLNTAPTESYGRSTREALYYGKFVMSLETNGISELRAERKSGQLIIIDPTKPDSWTAILRKLDDFIVEDDYSRRVWKQNEQDKINVVSSWK